MYIGVHPFLRRLHIWIGLLLLLPLTGIALTAVLLAHDRDLGLGDIVIESDWLPQEWLRATAKAPAVRAWLVIGEGDALIGTKRGLYAMGGGRLQPVAGLPPLDVRALRGWQGEVFVAARQGLWLSAHGRWHRLYQGDAHGINVDDEGNLYLAAHRAALVSRDGGASWQPLEGVRAGLAELEAGGPLKLKQLVRELHSGRLIVGRQREWIWIDAVSGLLLLTALIGVYRWRKQRNPY